MIKQFRIWLARRILGNHCACYRMGYHSMVDFQQRTADAIAKHKARKANNEQPTHTGQPGY
jgi:hypothetical protein